MEFLPLRQIPDVKLQLFQPNLAEEQQQGIQVIPTSKL